MLNINVEGNALRQANASQHPNITGCHTKQRHQVRKRITNGHFNEWIWKKIKDLLEYIKEVGCRKHTGPQ